MPGIAKQEAVEPPLPSERPVPLWVRLCQRAALGAILLLATFIDFYQLGLKGFGNAYYATSVKSMGDSLHNFFFVSYDPGGFISIDKPPLGFWLQVLSTKLFGFTPFSIFFPQALAGVCSVLLLYILVHHHFGAVAGLLAALALACSPISAVTNRNNTIDSTLVLFLLLAAWMIILAAESGKWHWLLLCAACLGISFNIKTLEAYLVIPAFGLLYILAAPGKFRLRAVQLGVALLVMLVISFSWIVIVDRTPASQRPYVGSSLNDSELSLTIGYNGLERLLGGANFDKVATGTVPAPTDISGGIAFQLFNETLGGQISWLLPLALCAILALAWQSRPRWRENREQQGMLLWSLWLLTMGIFFSIANFIHVYYMVTFAPAICALFGIGVVVMWRDYRRGDWRGWLLLVAIELTAVEQFYLIYNQPAWGSWLTQVIIVGSAIAILALLVNGLIHLFRPRPLFVLPMLCVGLAALLLTPAIWSVEPALGDIVHNQPSAGPIGQGGAGFQFEIGATNAGSDLSLNPSLLRYLEASQGRTDFLVAVFSTGSANSLILATNKPVMTLGGFSGRDPALSLSELQAVIASGTVRFFLLKNALHGGANNNRLIFWVEHTCPAILPHKRGHRYMPNLHLGNVTHLYDCRGRG